MPVKYESILPWGRNFNEYCHMFNLSLKDLKLNILDCAGGPSSFNMECNDRNGHVTSIDPLYHFDKEKIKDRIAETYIEILTQTIENKDKYLWNKFGSPMQLGTQRMAAMRKFLSSYTQGITAGHYVAGELPYLPFEKQSFELALCSHLLFLYSDQLDYNFHLQSIKSMLEVAREVRIFPLVDQNGKKSKYLNKLMRELADFRPEIRKVDYEFQKGANKMLILSATPEEDSSEDDYYKEMRHKYC